MEVVAYEWGAPSWYNHLSPDDEAQSQIGGAYSQYGGGWSSSKPYKYGTMNDEVYFVRGGMEDCTYNNPTFALIICKLALLHLNSLISFPTRICSTYK